MNYSFNPLPDDKILDQTKLKAFADDKLNVTKLVISVFDRVENFVQKGELASTSIFSFSHDVFKLASFPDPSKGVIVWEWDRQFVNFCVIIRICVRTVRSGLSLFRKHGCKQVD